ncbi:ATP phosphoribosyltransferase regulatory subunit [Cohnella ginsengisoli]|uniref:ATP phosphoribosyltransferase regulatory subunit n=1 Tax=Cohnella ginsengisoli TaxID=425004 RepID=A0A9X4KMJ6_9BACL|nr:ATP phosphoribosyltransferase regulatory subunit [Cohnella ginsengisoli]MDG0793037.1 ATP phosphoribosyltransferase regulatory subunit [Cohnella ginsengisoli]
MSKPKGFEKPIGVKDYLPHAVAKLRRIEHEVLACMRGWGYEQILTPTIEYYDTVGVASATSDQKLFKLLNQRGTTIVLRSDVTAPIARVASSLLKDHPFPLRLSYHANVFRAFEEEAGREAEFFQTGVELIGDPSPEADAEVIALAIASLKAAGVPSFKIAVGHVGFLNGLFGDTLPGRAEAQERLKECLLQRDYVGYRTALAELRLEDSVLRELEGLLRLRGGQEVCERALELRVSDGARDAIRHLCEMWDVLGAYGVQDHVLIDLTMIGDISYYTGMTFEGYASQLGFPVCSGGRYDNLLAQFGRPAPATGFALKTTRMLEVAEVGQEEPVRALIRYSPNRRREALEKAAGLRAEGLAVVTEGIAQTGDGRRAAGGSGAGDALASAPSGRYEYKGTVYDQVFMFDEKGGDPQ